MKPPFKWSLVTGTDFGKANQRARCTPNPVNVQIRAKLESVQKLQQLKASK